MDGWTCVQCQDRGCHPGRPTQISASPPIFLQALFAELQRPCHQGPICEGGTRQAVENQLHSFCQSGIIKPLSVCSLQTGMADQLWHKQNSRLGVNPGTDRASAGCDQEEEGVLRVAGFAFSLAEASRPLSLSKASLAPHRLPKLGGLLLRSGKRLASSSARHGPHCPQQKAWPQGLSSPQSSEHIGIDGDRG